MAVRMASQSGAEKRVPQVACGCLCAGWKSVCVSRYPPSQYTLTGSRRDASYRYQIAYVKSLPPSSTGEPTSDLIATALRLPDVFDLDSLFRLEAVSSVQDSPLLSLLKIFLNDGLAEYKAWEQSNEEAIAKFSKYMKF